MGVFLNKYLDYTTIKSGRDTRPNLTFYANILKCMYFYISKHFLKVTCIHSSKTRVCCQKCGTLQKMWNASKKCGRLQEMWDASKNKGRFNK